MINCILFLKWLESPYSICVVVPECIGHVGGIVSATFFTSLIKLNEYSEPFQDSSKMVQSVLDEAYDKVYYFWNYKYTYPMDETSILIVQDITDQ